MLSIEKLLVASTVLLLNLREAVALQSASFLPIVNGGVYKKEYEFAVNTSVEYVFLYPTNNVSINCFQCRSYSICDRNLLFVQVTWKQSVRIDVESNATHDVPLLVVVRQKRGLLSWQIPLVVDSIYFNDLSYNKTSRTLCSTKYYRSEPDEEEFLTVSLSTASHVNILFKLNVTEDPYFYLR